jgi:hypothetical protein
MRKLVMKNKSQEPACECDCANCEIGAHERCTNPLCRMPKWKDVKKPKLPKSAQ